jgi:hypothetical protein
MNFKNLRNKLYFHKKRVLVTSLTVPAYFYTCNHARTWENDILRMGVAGSLANLFVDGLFHSIDTLNIRAKANDKPIGTITMMHKIWRKEGPFGFGKGFSAMFYGSAACGFVYFAAYKYLKGEFKEKFGDKIDIGYCFLLASFSAELFTLFVQYPYDLVKCRLQSVNTHFKYQNLVHAFTKEVKTNGVRSLYTGVTPFLMTYGTFVALQFTIYEKMNIFYKLRYEPVEFEDKKIYVQMWSGFVAGVVAASVTNSLEAITV